MHYSISELSKYILCSNIKYDFIILTRYDMLSEITDFGNADRFKEKNTIFLWRTCPYISKEDAEDRIIVSSMLGLEKLSYLYDDYEKLLITENNHFSERIIGMQLNLYDELIKKEQNIIMNLSPYKSIKYSKEFDDNCNKLFNNYKLSKLLLHH